MIAVAAAALVAAVAVWAVWVHGRRAERTIDALFRQNELLVTVLIGRHTALGQSAQSNARKDVARKQVESIRTELEAEHARLIAGMGEAFPADLDEADRQPVGLDGS